MSTFSHSQDEERGKQPAREAPGQQGEVPRKRDDSKDDKSDPGIRRMADSVTLRHQRHENQGNVGARGCKRRSFGITHYTFCSTSLQEESNGDS